MYMIKRTKTIKRKALTALILILFCLFTALPAGAGSALYPAHGAGILKDTEPDAAGTVLYFTAQPESKAVTVAAGSVVSFTAESSAAVSWQWQYRKSPESGWANVSSAREGYNAATLTVTASASWNGFLFRCAVKDGFGESAVSDTVLLTVLRFDSQPENVTVPAGTEASFTADASWATAYRWQYRKSAESDWANVSSAREGYNAATLRITPSLSWNGYLFRCVVKTADGQQFFSDTAVLSVLGFTVQPTDTTAEAGSPASFSVEAVNAAGYCWQYRTSSAGSWTNVSSAKEGYNTETLHLLPLALWNGWQFRCIITASDGQTVFSEPAELTVLSIFEQPKDLTVASDSEAVFTVEASGAVWWQWQYLAPFEDVWTDCDEMTEGYNTAALELLCTPETDGWQFRCVIRSASGLSIVSDPAKLTVIEPSLSSVPDYYEAHLAEKITAIKDRAPVSGDQFVFITDIHFSDDYPNDSYHNDMHSRALIHVICEKTGVSKIFNGGDLAHTRGGDGTEKLISDLREGIRVTQSDTPVPSYFIAGNHDFGANDSVPARIGVTELENITDFYEAAWQGAFIDSTHPFQYYFDDAEKGIRYIVLCYGIDAKYDLDDITDDDRWNAANRNTEECAPFFLSALQSTPDGYSIVIFNHMTGMSSKNHSFSDVSYSGFINYLYKPLVAYQMRRTWAYGSLSADFTDAGGFPACVIFGHHHCDFTGCSRDIKDGGVSIGGNIPLFATTCDNRGGELGGITRTEGTYTEQAFDVFTIDTASKTVFVDRIGGGSDRLNGGNGYSYDPAALNGN